jgi:oligoribonuclease NrnB/cAMP/cGMP phosphodiesterase (DHH superfamily)
MNKSGAGLAWDYFNPGSPRPLVIDYIEDRDLWRFALPESKAINAWIQSFELGLDVWLKDGPMNDYFEFEKAVEAGHSILRMQQSLVRQICRNAVVKELNPPGLSTFTGPYVETSVLMSEVCDYLVKNFEGGSYPFAFYSYRSKDGKIQYGLRSRSEFDVSAIAKAFGGGGHKNAAGFELDSRI